MFCQHWAGFRHLSICLATLSLIGLSPDAAQSHPDISEAEDAIAHALEATPRDPALYVQRATLERERKDWDAAAASYTKAAALGANADTTDVGLAIVLAQAGLRKAGLARINIALDRNSENGIALFTRARILTTSAPQAAADDYAHAISAMDRPGPSAVLEAMDAQLAATSVEPEDAVVATGEMAADKVETEGDAIARALSIADVANKKLGIITTIQSRAVELEAQREDYDAAVARLDTMIEQAPEHEVWNARRGDLFAAQGAQEEADAAYRHTLALIEKRPPARRNTKIKSLEEEIRAKLAAEPDTQERDTP